MSRKNQRLSFILFTLACFTGAVAAGLYALRANISLFYTPSQLKTVDIPEGHVFSLGGLVEQGSLRARDNDLSVVFTVTDGDKSVIVKYQGILPDLFREGQGVVATGTFDRDGIFRATTLLAKHDENYMPPDVARALRAQHDAGIKNMQE